MIENARRLLRQKLGSVGTVCALAALSMLGAMSYAGGGSSGFVATLSVFVIAGGIVARDAATGALQMILVRPVRRVDYLLGRFTGALVLFSGVLLVAFAGGALFESATKLVGWSSGAPSFPWKSALQYLLADVLGGVLVLATLLFLSTFLRGIGDVIAFVVAALVIGLLPQFGRALHQPALIEASRTIKENLSPTVPLNDLLEGHLLAPAGSAYLLAFASYLLLACLIFNRREFSYGTD